MLQNIGIFELLYSMCCRASEHRRRLRGGDRPHGQNVMGAMPPSRPHMNFVMSWLYRAKRYGKNSLWKCKRCVDFSLKMHQKGLAAGLRSGPLGELTALPQVP